MGYDRLFLGALALAGLVWIGASPWGFTQPRMLINGYDESSAPFAYLDESDSPRGFDIEVLNRIAELEGFQISHETVVFDNLIPTLEGEFADDGDTIDMIDSGFAITPDREAQVSFTVPYLQIRKVLVVPADSSLTPNQILSGEHIVAVRDGSTEADWIDSNLSPQEGQGLQVYYYDGYDAALDDLDSGVVSAVVMDEATAKSYVQSDGVKISGELPMPPEQIGFAVRKDDTELLKTLNDGLNRLMASPDWQTLKQKYGLGS